MNFTLTAVPFDTVDRTVHIFPKSVDHFEIVDFVTAEYVVDDASEMDDVKDRPYCRSHGGLVGVMDDENQKWIEDDFNTHLSLSDEAMRASIFFSSVRLTEHTSLSMTGLRFCSFSLS